MDYDLIIIGAGAAGLTAGIYASRYQLKSVVVGDLIGGLTTEAHKIYNWPGEPGISGFELTKKMSDHVVASGGEVLLDLVNTVEKTDGGFSVVLRSGKTITSKTVLFTVGTKHRKLGLAREEELLGKGVAYCATCDGPFFKDKVVAMVGGGNSVISAAMYLSDVASSVYVICRGPELKGEPLWRDELIKKANVTMLYSTNVIDLLGQDRLTALKLDNPYKESDELVVDGMFVEIGLMPQTELFKSMGGEVNDLGYIKVKPDMSTNLPGVYAAGDSTDYSNDFHQIVTACSEGAIAADTIYKNLSVG